MILGIFAIYAMIFIFDLPLLVRAKNRKKLYTVYSLFFVLGLSFSLLQILDRASITPTSIIRWLVESTLKVV